MLTGLVRATDGSNIWRLFFSYLSALVFAATVLLSKHQHHVPKNSQWRAKVSFLRFSRRTVTFGRGRATLSAHCDSTKKNFSSCSRVIRNSALVLLQSRTIHSSAQLTGISFINAKLSRLSSHRYSCVTQDVLLCVLNSFMIRYTGNLTPAKSTRSSHPKKQKIPW